MTLTTTIDGSKGKFDWSRPVLAVVAACLVLLIVRDTFLPMYDEEFVQEGGVAGTPVVDD